MQSALVGTRASLYIFSLSSSLVALGFASQSPELFVPFVAIVLPAVFILGVFTAVRLVDSNPYVPPRRQPVYLDRRRSGTAGSQKRSHR